MAALMSSSRAAASVAARRSFSSTPAAAATLRELEGRIKSVKNIEKITKSMKMIATTRLNKAQEAMRQVQTYGKGSSEIYGEADVAKNAKDDVKTLWIVTSSDRGLCGGIHSAVSKKAKKEIALSSNHSDDRIVILGEKPKAQISRSMPDNIVLSVSQIGRAVPTFQEACAIAEKIEEANVEYDKVNLIYNAVISPIAYEPTVLEVFSTDQLRGAAGFNSYEVEDDGLIGDLTSFSLANAIFTALVEGHAAEISARRNAMDNASKNAGEMVLDDSDRARQPSQMTLWTSLQVQMLFDAGNSSRASYRSMYRL